MTYTKTTWVDEAPVSTPVKYSVHDDTLGDIATSAEIAVVTEVTSGTPLNATNMNHIEEGIETAQETADGAVSDAADAAALAVAADAAADAAQSTANTALSSSVLKSLFTAVGDLLYALGSGSVSKLAKPAFTGVLQETSAGTPSWRRIKQCVQVQLVDAETDVDSNGIGYFFIPEAMDGMNIVRANAYLLTAGAGDNVLVNVKNMTKYPSANVLSTNITIADGATIGTPGTVNTSYDNVSTNDKMKVFVNGAWPTGTYAKGLLVVLEYQL